MRRRTIGPFAGHAQRVWKALFQAFAEAAGPPAALLLDSTDVKAQRSVAGAKAGAIKRSAVSAAAAPTSLTSQPTKTSDRAV
jgi:hypothetical protein